ncbi:MAG: HAMP domain-containing protein [Bryobacterales bacterium]|nr:HAMP domain-containing protein [Bryobacterales bacterium]
MRLVTKLMIALTAIVVAVAVFSGLFTFKAEERQLLGLISQGADQLSRSITSATWHAMLADRRNDVYQVMETIALKQGIDRIRMFNRDGQVTFSTNPSEVNTRVTKDHETCSVCHSNSQLLKRRNLGAHQRIVDRADGGRSLAMVTPIYNERSCSEAACHAHPLATRVLGVLEIDLKLDTADSELASIQKRVLLRVCIEILLICLLVYFFVRKFISNPIHLLIRGAGAISRMELAEPIPVPQNSGEITELAASFDDMRERLRKALDEINEFTQKLESKVEERTKALDLAHRKLQQTDRLASLGQLSASVAHEINNPVAGVLNLAMLLQRLLKDEGVPQERLPDFRKYLGQIVAETSRVGRIVSDLLAFSRRSSPHRAPTDLNEIVRSTVSLIAHKLKLSNVNLNEDITHDLPPISCDKSQLQQVVLNLVMNAAESMQSKGGGDLEVATGRSGENLFLRVTDTGEGISPENLRRIFDPFFTTKPEGKGVGLGLAVSYGIVQAHGGDIEVKSKVGEGTAFLLTLPLNGTPQPPNGHASTG